MAWSNTTGRREPDNSSIRLQFFLRILNGEAFVCPQRVPERRGQFFCEPIPSGCLWSHAAYKILLMVVGAPALVEFIGLIVAAKSRFLSNLFAILL